VIKRVIALEGDVVRTKKPYFQPEVRVPQGHVWVEGDGEKTHDSNTYGPISMGLITGRPFFILRPLKQFGRIWPEPDAGRLVGVGDSTTHGNSDFD
jgi:mitochondrial inner membrane protease subunit 2